MDQVLELRGQHQVHEDERQGERPAEVVKRALQLAAAARDARGEAGRQAHLLGRRAEGLDAVGQRVAGRHVGPHRRHPLAVDAVDARRGFGVVEAHDVVQPRQRRRPSARPVPRLRSRWPVAGLART